MNYNECSRISVNWEKNFWSSLWKAYIFEERNFNYNGNESFKKIDYEGNQRFPILFYYNIKFFPCWWEKKYVEE